MTREETVDVLVVVVVVAYNQIVYGIVVGSVIQNSDVVVGGAVPDVVVIQYVEVARDIVAYRKTLL